jgi:O-acetyl-ADP-ribose deacetylase (regulator of RNase III)
MTVQYTYGDATAAIAEGNKLIAHVCNDRGGWGKGFVVAVSRRWPEPEQHYRNWSHTNDFRLGATQLVQVEYDTWVANMLAQHGYRSRNNPLPLRYDALEACLHTLAAYARRLDASVHIPRIGCGLAGGAWTTVSGILDRTLGAARIDTTVYDLSDPRETH